LLNVVIAKPTKKCNARCSYCAAATTAKGLWSFDDFKMYFDKLSPYIPDEGGCLWLWHGGEPMLLGPDFYLDAYCYAKERKPNINMSMQTNMLDYSTDKWYEVLKLVCGGGVSTSFDPDACGRIYQGSAENYTKRFLERIQMAMDDGLGVSIIGTYTDEMYDLDLHNRIYDIALSYGSQAFTIRYNYRYPAGRAQGKGDFITPETYGKMLVDIYNRWVRDVPKFGMVPHQQIIEKILSGPNHDRCPWTRKCGGHFIGLEPDGRVWNCPSFADTGNEDYVFGNLKEQSFEEIYSSQAARAVRRRMAVVPKACTNCQHFDVCQGGCARDTILFGGELFDRTKYCQSWMMLIDRIKQSIESGEADRLIRTKGYDRFMERRAFSHQNMGFLNLTDNMCDCIGGASAACDCAR